MSLRRRRPAHGPADAAAHVAPLPHPRPFIEEDPSSADSNQTKFRIGHEVAEYLAQLDCPVAVIAIAGMYRTGKSFILNQFCGRSSGFDLGSTVDACTQGIWLWSIDDPSVLPDAPSLPPGTKVLLLDTEGLNSTIKSETHDIQIFSLSLLLSSFFIYNSVGSIDESALDLLSLVVELTKHIRTQSEENPDSAARHLSTFFPTFLWLVRDFSLQLESAGVPITANEYLERALEPVRGDSKRVHGKNQIRRCIAEFFPHRECVTLKRPVHDEAQLQTLGDLPTSRLRPEYLAEVDALKRRVFRLLQGKQMYGDFVTGPMLLQLAQMYVAAINEGAIPTIRTAWENVVQIQCAKALADAKAMYQTHLREVIAEFQVLEADDLEKVHTQIRRDALLEFQSRAVGESFEAFETELLEFIDTTYLNAKRDNAERSRADSVKLLTNLVKQLDDQIPGEVANLEALQTAWRRIVDQFQTVARGPLKNITLAEFLGAHQLPHARAVLEHIRAGVVHEWEAKLADAGQKAAKEYGRLNDLFDDVQSQWKSSQESNRQLQSRIDALSATVVSLERDVSDKHVSLKDATDRAAETSAELQRVNEENRVLRAKLIQLAEAEAETTKDVTAIELDRDTFRREVENLEKERVGLQEEFDSLAAKNKKCSMM